MERLETAVAKAEAAPSEAEESGRSRASAPPPAAPGARALAASRGQAGAAPYEEAVVTASRRAQSSLEAPNATTIITAEEIRLSGATSLAELLRRVPGADVMALGVGSANVSLRGFNQRIANKVLVLVDGRTEYQDFLGLTLWSAHAHRPGGDRADRGHPRPGLRALRRQRHARRGQHHHPRARAPGRGRIHGCGGLRRHAWRLLRRLGRRAALRYRASACGYQQADKWSRDFASDRPDMAPQRRRTRTSACAARAATLSATYTFADAGAGPVRRRAPLLHGALPAGPAAQLLHGRRQRLRQGATLALGPLKLKAFWNHICTADAGPQYEAIGQRSLATTVSLQRLQRGAALQQGASTLGGEHQLNVGVEGRLKRVGWNYLGPLREELHAAAFVQDEWRLVQPLRLVASYRVDRHPLLDNGTPGLAHSPRVSALFIPFEGHAFRASAALRLPRAHLPGELHAPCPCPCRASTAPARSPPGSEHAARPSASAAFELGYRGEAPTLGVDWDVAALPEHGEGPHRPVRRAAAARRGTPTTRPPARTCWAARSSRTSTPSTPRAAWRWAQRGPGGRPRSQGERRLPER